MNQLKGKILNNFSNQGMDHNKGQEQIKVKDR